MDLEQHDKKKMNVEKVDRLSSLPDDLIHKIHSFIGIKRAIKMSALSSRWRFLWTSMPFLDFSIQDFDTLPKFSQFVKNVLSRRSNLAQVYSITLRFCGDFSLDFVKQLMNYAFSHNIQQLNLACLLEKHIEFPLSLFTSRSLKHLRLAREYGPWSTIESTFSYSVTVTSTLDLPALTTLYLRRVTLCDDNNDKSVGLFSKCVNLKKLTLESCRPKGSDCLSISLPQLSDLVLEHTHRSWEVVNLVVPQLKNLTIRNSSWKRYQISAPELASFIYSGSHPLLISTDGFHSLQKADLCVLSPDYADAPSIVHLFQLFQNVKFLRLNLEILELLSPYLEIISRTPSPFANLKSLDIYPMQELWDDKEEAPEKVNMSVKVKNYLLSNSLHSTFTMVSREEIRDKKNTKLAQEHMERFQERLEYEKSKIETKWAHMETKKAPMESHNTKRHVKRKTKLENLLMIEERTNQINMCWNDLSEQIEEKKEKTLDIISELQEIKVVLTKLPASKRGELQVCFSSLCAEADTFLNKIVDHLKMQCDKKGNRFSGYIHELASTSE